MADAWPAARLDHDLYNPDSDDSSDAGGMPYAFYQVYGHHDDWHNAPAGLTPTPLQQGWTQDQCTSNVLEVFPDVSIKHISDLYSRYAVSLVDELLCQVTNRPDPHLACPVSAFPFPSLC